MAILRRIKKKAKKMVSKKKVARNKKVKTIKPAAVIEVKKEAPGVSEVAIGSLKFSHPEPTQPKSKTMIEELPSKYGQEKIILQVRDPWWLHTYWEVGDLTMDRFKKELKDEFYRAKRVLRVYDVSNIIFNGQNANRFFDIEIRDFSNSWYIDTASPGRSWCVDLGLRLSNGRFITILRSNVVETPLDGPSWITDEEWMIPDDMFARLYGMGFGLGRSSPVGRAWRERIISSGGIASMVSPVKKPLAKKFWLKVDCELIVYGATEANAKVTVQGKPINLRRDGTFTLRFSLPDSKQVIPVKAVSADKQEERTITPIVIRETK
ncbi:MAG: DUF4912 domain-containing protein [Candidatus Omnitrophica bacterium]|nr:DUF4912 domain-containing protein [Candidatus Omnitrophota bacterium]